MDFIELRVSCSPQFREILIAEIGTEGFDSMMETEDGFYAYCEEELFDPSIIKYLENKYGSQAELAFESSRVVKENWNEQWEKNFDPVIINDRCLVRASFHKPSKGFTYEIIINPKMSFGTGHHATTSLMIEMQMETDHKGKSVIDCGCGTGILSIFAFKLGASSVLGIDTDSWAIENSIENAQTNDIETIKFQVGSIDNIGNTDRCDIILANINKNILLSEMSSYARSLKEDGRLLLSGFYSADMDDLILKASENNLSLLQSKKMNDWMAATFIRK